MDKQRFKQEQPVVYKTLSNALTHDHLAHAYLFTGPKTSPKQEVAILLAQSLVCPCVDEDGFACQECETCKRIEKEDAIDFRWIGKEGRIKKKDILDLQSFFESTSVETANRRIYFLEHFDQVTPDAANSLLKFLEEPRPGIFAILSAEERANVLPTIASRCQWIPFRPASIQRKAIELEGLVDAQMALMLAHFGYTKEWVLERKEDPDLMLLYDEARTYTQRWSWIDEIFHLQRDVFATKTERLSKEKVRYFLEWVLYLVQQKKTGLDLTKQVQVQSILIESLDRLWRPVELALFLDKIYNQIRKVVMS